MSLRAPLFAAGLLALLSPGAPARPQDGSSRLLTAGPDRRVELDFQHFYTQRDLEVALQALAGAYPEFLTLETMGQSRGGHELWVMTVARHEGVDPDQRPALFVAGGLGAEDLHGTEMALFTILELVQNHARDPEVGKFLTEAVCYVAPCLNPDLRERVFGDPAERVVVGSPVRLDGNFPIGWVPGEGSGAYPLSEPETFQAAEFVLGHPNIALVQTYTGTTPAPDAGTTSGSTPRPKGALEALAPADQRGFAAVLTGIPNPDRRAVQALVDLDARGGSLLEFAYGQHGAFPFQTLLPGSGTSRVGPSVPEVFELAPLGRRAFRTTIKLARTLPRLALGPATARRLSDDLWQIDVEIENAGVLPTTSDLGAQRFACGVPELTLTGADLLAAGVRRGTDPHLPVEGAQGRLRLSEIAGGEGRSVRLVVRASAETSVVVQVTSPRAGSDSVQILLQ